MTTESYVHVDFGHPHFLVDKRAFMDQEVFDRERRYIFSRAWLYVGHDSEIREPGAYLTRDVGQNALLFNRDRDGVVHAFHNVCTHRGTVLAMEKCGKAKSFTCPYHGWTFGANGTLLDQNAKTGYPPRFNAEGTYNLRQVPRLERYRGFWFMNMNPKAVALEKYLAGTKEWIDLIIDQSDAGIEVTSGEQEFIVNCNWKLISENQIDSYHGISLHSSYFRYAMKRSGETPQQQAEQYKGQSWGLGNGHGAFEVGVRPGRPVADWVPAFGAETKPIIDANKERLIAKYGIERGTRMTTRTRNMLIFPNTILNDVMSVSIRTAWPETPTKTRASIWNLAPVDEHPAVRKIRLQNHLTFVGPGGFAHPDDYEIFDRISIGNRMSPPTAHDYSKGMVSGVADDLLTATGDHADETQQRAWWTQWDRVLRGAEILEA